ncbi:hypothetical protein Pcinc_024558 [Petrolisthes cinctipes]|uniref:Hamartin n=1 Tax=Petrolisthes cinctipes TaxID=88211 RepID=A0AAE1KF42_PETCI|nr:hypothetical protein Pcinc_024558 [Petrolisthes cinctipes]
MSILCVSDGSGNPGTPVGHVTVTAMEARELNVGDLLGLLESPQQEVCHEVLALLKETFSSIREPWLITGLLEYFYVSNSGRLLDLLLSVHEPHDRHLLERLMEGLKGTDRLRHTCILLYAARRQPPPMWLRKFLNHGAMRELFNILLNGEDVPVLVGAVMVLVILLPNFPLEMARLHLPSMMEVFCRLVRWTPKRELDASFQPFLQVAVYSLFHRLYAFYPCHFLTCLRISFSKPHSSRCFFSTLKPMMETVRLHPLLITETKESEITRSRFMGLEPYQLILESAKMCLDPIEATCEDVSGPFFGLGSNVFDDAAFEGIPMPTRWLMYAVENKFWSPTLSLSSLGLSATSSFKGSTSSIPHTPVFPLNTPALKPTPKVAESPPEAAIEATPETTPFTSPMKQDTGVHLVIRKPKAVMGALSLNTAAAASVSRDSPVSSQSSQPCPESEGNSSPLSPVKKDKSPFKFPDDQCQDIFARAEKSTLLQTKLRQMLKERQQYQKEGEVQQAETKGEKSHKDTSMKEVRESVGTREIRIKEPKELVNIALSARKLQMEKQESIRTTEKEVTTKVREVKISVGEVGGNRRRKVSVYDGSRIVDLTKLEMSTDKVGGEGDDLDFTSEENKTTNNDTDDVEEKGYHGTLTILRERISEEKEIESGDSRRSSDETQPYDGNENNDDDEDDDDGENVGLGIPNQRSMTDLVKNMRTMRLRFLSQCGPPPDLTQYNLGGGALAVTSPSKPGSSFLSQHTLVKTLSCPNLAPETGKQVHFAAMEGRMRKESAISSLTLSPIRQAVVTCEATTQTEEITVINPYEQLLEALMSGPTTNTNSNTSGKNANNADINPSPHELLDQYLQYCSKTREEGKNILWKQQAAPSSTLYEALKNQVRLMQVMLLVERHKREAHAERNRRLLGQAKRVYALEEDQKGLKDEVAQLEGEITRLKLEMHNANITLASKEQQLQSVLAQQQEHMNQVTNERDTAQEQRDLLKEQCHNLKTENEKLRQHVHKTRSQVLDRDRQLLNHSKLLDENKGLNKKLETLKKQAVLMGEVQAQYKQEVWKLTLARGPAVEVGVEQERAAAQQQMEDLDEKYRLTSASLDAALSQVAELEQSLQEKNRLIEERHQAVKTAREIGAEQCRAVELRCQALASTNQTLETYILEQNDRIDRLVRQVRRSQRGKSVCSDGLDFDLELSASPPSTNSGGGSATTTSPADDTIHPPGSLLATQSQQVILTKLDVLAEAETELDVSCRRKT